MTLVEAKKIVGHMAKAYYAKDPTYPETLDRQKEAINLLEDSLSSKVESDEPTTKGISKSKDKQLSLDWLEDIDDLF